MAKRLLLLAMLAGFWLPGRAQQFLFFAPDTVCIKQPIQLVNNVPGAAGGYFWSFCSGYTVNDPVPVHPADTFKYHGPTAIEIVRDGNTYYGFVTTTVGELIRLDFGDSLNSIPGVTNFGDIRGTIPDSPSSLFMVRDTGAGTWHLFVAGGVDSASSSLARVDFGRSLGSVPNSVNFGNLQGLLRGPRGLFIDKEKGRWTGYFTNSDPVLPGVLTGLGRLDFDTNISLTPFVVTPQQYGGFLSGPSDLAAIKRGGDWYFLVTNLASSTLTVYTLDDSLRATPTGNNLGNFGASLFNPTGISVTTDCGGNAAFVTNGLSQDVLKLTFTDPADLATYTDRTILNTPGIFAIPTSISTILRDSSDLFAFVTNFSDSSLTRLDFLGCDDATIPSSTLFTPPVYSYDTPGVYNVYFVANDGTPSAQSQCQQIVVLPYPAIDIVDDTLICQGDSARLFVASVTATSIRWRPLYNFFPKDTTNNLAFVTPEYTVDYRVVLAYSNGCIVDTGVTVTVSKVEADAGPDRTLRDGASSLLGGPGTTLGRQYAYRWSPSNFLDNDRVPNPETTAPRDFTYYLTVINEAGCFDIDTVVVKVDCDDINLPNAFTPGGPNPATARFGLLNRNIIKLNFFRVYDRWGKKLFETTDPTKEWDGTVDGTAARLGVYIWEADGFCSSGERFTKRGNVTLIR